MRISQVVEYLEKIKKELGDIPLYSEVDTGRETYYMPCKIKIEFREIWKNHPGGKRYFITVD